MNRTRKTTALWIALVVVAAFTYSFMSRWPPSSRSESFSEFMARFQEDDVKEVLFTGGEIEYVTYRGGTFHTVLPEGFQGLANKLVDRDVKVTARPATTNVWTSWGPVLLWTPWGPALLLMAFLLFFYPPGALRGGGSVPLGGGSGGPTSTIL